MIPAQANAHPEIQISYTIGMIVGALLPVLFLGLAIKTLTKEHHSRKCATSISVMMAGWSVSSLFYLASHLTSIGGLTAVGYVVGGSLALVALGFAIWGLMEVADSRSTLKGAWQAVLSLVLCGVFVIGASFAILIRNQGIPDDWKMPQPPPGSRVSVVPKNFSLAVPGGDWVQVVPTKLNTRADLAFVNPRKTLYFMVLAHPVPPGGVRDLDRFTEAARAEIKQMDPAGIATPAQPKVIGPYPGMEFSADASIKGRGFAYYEWLTVKGSVAYQMIAWSLRADAELLRLEAARIAGSFESLTP